jgi:hypothetical protein
VSSPGGSKDPGRFWVPAAVLLVLLPTLGLFWGAIIRGHTFNERDLGSYYRAAKSLVAPLTRGSGGLPLWNPYFGAGQPFAANPEHELFHPFTTLLLLLPFEWVFRLQVILPTLIGVGALFALLRGLRRSRPASLFGGIAWGFGGYLLSTTNLLPILFAVSILPLVVLFALRVWRNRRLIDMAALALVVALVALAGEPSTLLMTPLLVAAGLASERRPGNPRALVQVGAGLILGLLLAAATLLPGLHHASKTVRADGLPATVANEWSMPPVRLLELLAPHVLGHVDRRDVNKFWGRHLFGSRVYPFLYSLYPGLLTTLFALAAWTIRRRTLWPWILVASLGFLVALGEHFPLWGLLRRLPLLSGVRFPEKFVLLTLFPLTVAAGYGFDQIVHGSPQARRAFVLALLPPLGLGLVTAAGVSWIGLTPQPGGRPPAFPADLAAWDALRVALVATLASVLFISWPRLGRSRGALLVCAGAALDLVLAGKALVRTVPVARVAAPPSILQPLIARRKDDVLFHLAALDPELSMAGGLALPPIPAQWGIAMALDADFDLTELRWSHDATELIGEVVQRNPALLWPLLHRRGVTAVLKFRKGVHWQGERLALPPGASSALELLFSDQARFAFAASRVEIVRGPAGWMEAVQRLGAASATTACIDDEQLSPSSLLFSQPPAPADVKIVGRTPARLAIDMMARGPGPSFLAINQTWDEGWQARIDGQLTRLYRTDLSLSGLVVPPGRHRIELDYADPWVAAGVVLSLLAGLTCAGLALWRPRRRGELPAIDQPPV